MEAKSLAGYHKKKEGGTFQSTIRSSTSFVTAMSTAKMTPSLDGSRTCVLGGRLPPAPLDAGALHAPAEQP